MAIEIPCEKELRLMASILYSWETESRYKESFIAALKDIEEVLDIADSLMLYVTSEITPVVVEEKDFPSGKLE